MIFKTFKKLARVPCPCMIVLAIVQDRERPCETVRDRIYNRTWSPESNRVSYCNRVSYWPNMTLLWSHSLVQTCLLLLLLLLACSCLPSRLLAKIISMSISLIMISNSLILSSGNFDNFSVESSKIYEAKPSKRVNLSKHTRMCDNSSITRTKVSGTVYKPCKCPVNRVKVVFNRTRP